MATKMYNSHLNNIMDNCKEYFIFDVYIALVHMASEVDSIYLIQLFDHTKNALIKAIMKYIDVKRDTIRNCIDTLMNINILEFSVKHNAWILKDMENMHKEKIYDGDDTYEDRKFSGYTKIRKLFLSGTFTSMKAREKRLIIHLTQLCDSKASKYYKAFFVNLIKPNNNWLKILKTKSKYYAKYTIENLLKKHKNLFIKNSLEEQNYNKENTKAFRFNFSCNEIKKVPTDNDAIELVRITHKNEYTMIKDKLTFSEVTLSKQKVMQLIRVIANIKEWSIKEIVVQRILNKFRANQIHRSREVIKSIPAYGAVLVKDVLGEFERFKATIERNTIAKYEIGEYFIEANLKYNNI